MLAADRQCAARRTALCPQDDIDGGGLADRHLHALPPRQLEGVIATSHPTDQGVIVYTTGRWTGPPPMAPEPVKVPTPAPAPGPAPVAPPGSAPAVTGGGTYVDADGWVSDLEVDWDTAGEIGKGIATGVGIAVVSVLGIAGAAVGATL
ncbi:hypothetical protein [Streptomyces sp. NPDC059909]|uniref:hypothetical protein n=1 Tax=Streptomyces sp. NPDC059909 TaxID=3346998 RepID=UPI00365188F3